MENCSLLPTIRDNLMNYNQRFLFFSGIGYGLIYLPSIVSVSQYFKKRRAFATGLGVSGSGIGTFAFSPITSLLINKYTWRGAILIQSGLVLNCVACGLVFLPVKVGLSRKSPPIVKSVKQTSTYKNGSKTYDNIENNSAKEALIFGTKDGAELKEESDAECNELKLSLQNSRNKLESNDNTLVSTATPDNHRKRVSSPFDMRIFSSVPFCLFLVSTFFYSMGYYVPYIYLPDMAIETGKWSKATGSCVFYKSFFHCRVSVNHAKTVIQAQETNSTLHS